MWWNGPGWGPMFGWWIMPLIGLVFMVVFLFIVFRFFGAKGGFCGMDHTKTDHSKSEDDLEAIKKEIQSLKDEIKSLKNNAWKGNEAWNRPEEYL